LNLQAYTSVNESAKITGVALIPRISRNNNLYTKQELERFDGVTVPLNWEHDPTNIIGQVTFHYNPSQETVYYEGVITNEASANVARNKLLFTSIEATPTEVSEICNGQSDCFAMPFGLKPEGLALTETPGVPETSVKVIENYIKECNHHALEADTVAKVEGVSTTDFINFRNQILDHLNVEECGDCHKLHSKKN
jgi:hypothetical protein|tara:strand:+ start:892 stop:1476 length:585 start_codon:yes stop_codon:yes gene_type:complete